MGRAERKALIEQLEGARGGTKVIAYVTSTRTGFEAPMAMDVIPVVHRHLRAIQTPPSETKIDLFIHSNGGEGVVPWRLVALIREFCNDLTVLVPNRAFSAATLTALGADEVIMHPMGMLGPIDPTVSNPFNPPNPRQPGQLLGISVEDVTSYIALVRDDVGIRHEDELVQAFLAMASQVHPLALGNVKRSTSQSRMMAEKLLGSRRKDVLPEHEVSSIIKKLTSELYYHGHPINRKEAREDLKLSFVKDASTAVEEAMWKLYEAYEQEMVLGQVFDTIIETVAKAGALAIPTPPQPFTMANARLDPLRAAYVESMARCDLNEVELDSAIRRDVTGKMDAVVTVVRSEWKTE